MTQQQPPELTEDIEVIGPGQMLAEGRKRHNLSIEDVAKRLNIRVTLVKEIEAEKFDAKVPVTFTRGYLKNYAKLVEVPVDEVLASFELLGVAKTQSAEMQSFSKQTSKEAENNRVIYIGYFIVAVLIALTVLWWLQESKKVADNNEAPAGYVDTDFVETNTAPELIDNDNAADSAQSQDQQAALDELVNDLTQNNPEPKAAEIIEQDSELSTAEQASAPVASVSGQSTVVFTFAGDCWVNIYDSTGERIAWGIKREGYVMTISGVAPFNITLGKPELVSIEYNQSQVDMSAFPAGHIAKFELPLNE